MLLPQLMKKLLLASVLAIASFPGYAHAGNSFSTTLPPEKYDVPYTGLLKIWITPLPVIEQAQGLRAHAGREGAEETERGARRRDHTAREIITDGPGDSTVIAVAVVEHANEFFIVADKPIDFINQQRRVPLVDHAKQCRPGDAAGGPRTEYQLGELLGVTSA